LSEPSAHIGRSIVVASGDLETRAAVTQSLASNGFHVCEVETGRQALKVILANRPDLVVTEMVLPDLTGLGLCRLIREDEELFPLPVVMITDYGHEVDRVLAFESGVDDVVAKPFSARELAARVRAILRRKQEVSGADGAAHRAGELLSTGSPLARVRWEREPTAIERRLLEQLAARGGRVMSRGELLTSVWGRDAHRSDRVVDAHVKGLRAKLGRARGCVETVRGVGYRFREERLS
jgi:two-component system, OmpR family, phosphate regulon response regulator PhoB